MTFAVFLPHFAPLPNGASPPTASPFVAALTPISPVSLLKGVAPAANPQTLDLRGLAKVYWVARRLSRASIQAHETTLKKWDVWLYAHRFPRPMPISAITTDHLTRFAEWLQAAHVSDGHRNPGRSTNKAMEHVRALLRYGSYSTRKWCAAPEMPERTTQRSVAGLAYFGETELNSLYDAAERFPDHRFWRAAFPLSHAWTAALLGAYLYGWDTSTIWPTRPEDSPILVSDVSWEERCPLFSHKATNPTGWISWMRGKTAKRNPVQHCRPMPPAMAAHIRRLMVRRKPNEPLFGIVGRPSAQFHKICKLAGLPNAKLDDGTVVPLNLKYLRKTCATIVEERHPGVAGIVLGHAPQTVTGRHYTHTGPLVFQATMDMPIFSSALRILSSS